MKLHSAFAALGLAGAASADLSFTFDFDFFVEDNGFINGFVYSDLSSEYVGETLTSFLRLGPHLRIGRWWNNGRCHVHRWWLRRLVWPQQHCWCRCTCSEQ